MIHYSKILDANVVEDMINTRPMVPASLAAEVVLIHGRQLREFLADTGRSVAQGYDGAAILEWLGY